MGNIQGLRSRRGRLYLIGIGPGPEGHMTGEARKKLLQSQAVVGYKRYLKQISSLTGGKEVYSFDIGQELDRAQKAIELANSGKIVSLVSGGDPGVYGMAGALFEALIENGWDRRRGFLVEVVPGVSAALAAAALIGSPIVNDFATISLSDHLAPWNVIVRRLECASQGDFVIVIYNPKSKERKWQLDEARRIIMKYRPDTTPVGIITKAYREGQRVVVTDLRHLLDYPVDMQTTVIIGNSLTQQYQGLMVTRRGYFHSASK